MRLRDDHAGAAPPVVVSRREVSRREVVDVEVGLGLALGDAREDESRAVRGPGGRAVVGRLLRQEAEVVAISLEDRDLLAGIHEEELPGGRIGRVVIRGGTGGVLGDVIDPPAAPEAEPLYTREEPDLERALGRGADPRPPRPRSRSRGTRMRCSRCGRGRRRVRQARGRPATLQRRQRRAKSASRLPETADTPGVAIGQAAQGRGSSRR